MASIIAEGIDVTHDSEAVGFVLIQCFFAGSSVVYRLSTAEAFRLSRLLAQKAGLCEFGAQPIGLVKDADLREPLPDTITELAQQYPSLAHVMGEQA